MKVEWNDKTYDFDVNEISVKQAIKIRDYLGSGLNTMVASLNDGDPRAVQCVAWLMMVQAGEDPGPIEDLDFSLTKFSEAVSKAMLAEMDKAITQSQKPGHPKGRTQKRTATTPTTEDAI